MGKYQYFIHIFHKHWLRACQCQSYNRVLYTMVIIRYRWLLNNMDLNSWTHLYTHFFFQPNNVGKYNIQACKICEYRWPTFPKGRFNRASFRTWAWVDFGVYRRSCNQSPMYAQGRLYCHAKTNWLPSWS